MVIMKKIILLSMLLLCGAFSSQAQFRISSVRKAHPDIQLKYVKQTDTTTQVFGVFTMPQVDTFPALLSFSRRMHISDGDMDYRLLDSDNIPVMDGSIEAYAVFDKPGQKTNLILEFEKIDLSAPFDLIENESDDKAFNFYGIEVDTTSIKKLDNKRYLSSAPVMRCGEFYEDGHHYTFYEKDGVFVAAYPVRSDDFFMYHFIVVNDSDHGVLLNTGTMKATGRKFFPKEIKEVGLNILTPNDYKDLVWSNDRYQAEKEAKSQGLSEVGSAVSIASIGLQYRSPEYTGLRVLGGFLRDINSNNMKPYMKELDATREERVRVYLRSQSLKAGENLSGVLYVDRKEKRIEECVLTVPIDEMSLTFKWLSGK